MGQPEKQRAFREWAIKFDEQTYGPDHPTTAVTRVNLANAHGRIGNAVDMKSFLLRSWYVFMRSFKKEHLHCFLTELFLAEAHAALNEIEDANRRLKSIKEQLDHALPT